MHILVLGRAIFRRWMGLWRKHRFTYWVALDLRFLDRLLINLYLILLVWVYDGHQQLDLAILQIIVRE